MSPRAKSSFRIAMVVWLGLVLGCASEIQLKTFDNALADLEDELPVSDEIEKMALSHLLSPFLPTAGPESRLLRKYLFYFSAGDSSIRLILNKYGFLTLDDIWPYREDLLYAFEELSDHADSLQGSVNIPLSEIPQALPHSEFDFAANLQAIYFTFSPLARAILDEDRESDSDGVLEAWKAASIERMRRYETVVGRRSPALRGEHALREAIVCYHQGQLEDAVTAWDKAIDAFAGNQSTAVVSWQIRTLTAVALLLHHQNDDAIKSLELAVSDIEALHWRSYSSGQGPFSTKIVLFELIIEALVDRGRIEQALQYAEKSKARVFFEATDEPGGGVPSQAARDQFEELAAEILAADRKHRRFENVISVKRNRSGLLESQPISLLARSEAWFKYQTLRSRLAALNAASTGNKDPPPNRRWNDITEPLREYFSRDWAVIYYFAGANRLHIWVLGDGDQLHYVNIEKEYSELLADIRNLRRAVAHRADLEPSASELYRELIEPVQSLIAGRDLLIVPHQALHFLPFEVLSKSGRFLILDHDIAYVPSLDDIRPSRRPRRLEAGRFLGIANPDLTLENSEKEVQLARLGFARSQSLVRREATKDAVFGTIAGSSVVHFASHVTLEESYPLLSSMVLHDEDRLYLFEVPWLGLNADLVVLSGCNTNLGEIGFGDDLQAMSRSFLSSGQGFVVVSLWEVEDRSGYEFMRNFYGDLNRYGYDPITSAAATKRFMINHGYDVNPRGRIRYLNHPYYWAPFVVIGAPALDEGTEERGL